MRVLAGAEGSVMGFIASCIQGCHQPASSNTTEGTDDINIAKFVKPKVVHGVGRGHEVAFAKLLVGFCSGDIELM
jgi:hypothetical protein